MFSVGDYITKYVAFVNALKAEKIDKEFIKNVKESNKDIIEFLEKIENYFMNRKAIDSNSLKENEMNFLNKMDTDIELFMHRNKEIKDNNGKLVDKLDSVIQKNITSYVKENTIPVTSGFKGFINSICKLFKIDPPYKKENISSEFKEKLQNINNKQTNESKDESRVMKM